MGGVATQAKGVTWSATKKFCNQLSAKAKSSKQDPKPPGQVSPFSKFATFTVILKATINFELINTRYFWLNP